MKALIRGGLVLLLLVVPAGNLLATNGNENDINIRFDFWGFSIAPDPVNPGDRLEIVGVIQEETTSVPLNLDFLGNEYTIHVHGLVLIEVIENPPLLELHYSFGLCDIYEDPSFNAPFQADTDPDQVPDLDPLDVPANFTDGTLLVRFLFRDYIALFFPPAGIGTIAYTNTELQSIGGSGHSELQQQYLTIGWHMGGGFTDDGGAFIPAGYGMRYDALVQWESPLPVQPTSWGNIKGVFR